MEVTVDGQVLSVEGAGCMNLADLVSFAEAKELDGETVPTVVVQVLVDGQAIPADEMATLEQRSLSGIGKVELHRRSTASVAQSVLIQGADYTREISKAIEQVIEHYQGSRTDRGNALLANVTDSMSVLIGITESVSAVMSKQAETLAALQGELAPWLEEMIQAQVASDPVRLSDLLEYEIRPRIELWGETMRSLAAERGGSGGAVST